MSKAHLLKNENVTSLQQRYKIKNSRSNANKNYK